MDWIGWLSFTAVTPTASLQSDANEIITLQQQRNEHPFLKQILPKNKKG